jgi:hypothetical protein
MKDNQTRANGVCRRCRCNEAAAADARTVGLLDEFLAGIYTCCQVVHWADEQWLAWQEAGGQDRKVPEEVARPLEVEPDALFVPVLVRKRKSPADPKIRRSP